MIFFITSIAHRKLDQRGPFTIISEVPDYSVPRPAIHTRCCPVGSVSSSLRIDIGKTLLTGRDVRRDHPGHGSGTAGQDQEVIGIGPIPGVHRDIIDPGKRRACAYGTEEILEFFEFYINQNFN